MLVHYHESFGYKNEKTKELEIGRRDDRESLTSFVWPRRWALSIACKSKVRFQSLSYKMTCVSNRQVDTKSSSSGGQQEYKNIVPAIM